MRTLYTRTADGITVRLIERATKPRFIITQDTRKVGGFVPVGNDRNMAILEWIKAVERIQPRPFGRRAG